MRLGLGRIQVSAQQPGVFNNQCHLQSAVFTIRVASWSDLQSFNGHWIPQECCGDLRQEAGRAAQGLIHPKLDDTETDALYHLI